MFRKYLFTFFLLFVGGLMSGQEFGTGKLAGSPLGAQADSLLSELKRTRLQHEEALRQLGELNRRQTRDRKIGLGMVAVLILAGALVLNKRSNQLKSLNQHLEEEKKRSEELLHNVLPAEVARQLKSRAAARAHRYESVSVLFSDFQNFSGIAKDLSPEELVAELDYCFTEFDRIIDKYRLQKIKTIGDAYMCVGGLYTRGSSHVVRTIYAALEMQHFLEKLKLSRQSRGQHFFEARIGIHTGPVVAGVVGTKKFAFDLWGDTVNVAQQMEAHGAAGRVNISGETFELVKKQFICSPRGQVKVKNNAVFEMYFVEEAVKNV